MPTEIELKLHLDPGEARNLRLHPLLAANAVDLPRTRQLLNIYFDTAELDLLRRGAALRVRRSAGRWIQTLKGGGGASAGLHQRGEWECAVADARPDLAALHLAAGKQVEVRPLVGDSLLADRLIAVFTTRFRRTTWLLQLPGARVELALDQGKIICEHRHEPISELELELLDGEPGLLFDFALELLDTLPLRPMHASKAQRGYALRAGGTPVPAKACAPRLEPGMPLERGFMEIVDTCLGQIQANEEGVLESGEAEFVHQMRVGLRRLRAALSLFSPVIARPARLVGELKWLAGELGGVRDWEVLASELLPSLPARLQRPGWAELCAAAGRQAVLQRSRAREAIVSARYARLVLSMGRWLQGRRWREVMKGGERRALDAPLTDFAGRRLATWHQRLLRRGRRAGRQSQAERHALRIVAKKVRYATELLSALHAGGRNRRYVRVLAQLQDILGRLNDSHNAQRLLNGLPAGSSGQRHAVHRVCAWLAQRERRDVAQLEAAWRDFAACPLPME